MEKLAKISYLEIKVEGLETSFYAHMVGHMDPYSGIKKPDCKTCERYEGQIQDAKAKVIEASR